MLLGPLWKNSFFNYFVVKRICKFWHFSRCSFLQILLCRPLILQHDIGFQQNCKFYESSVLFLKDYYCTFCEENNTWNIRIHVKYLTWVWHFFLECRCLNIYVHKSSYEFDHNCHRCNRTFHLAPHNFFYFRNPILDLLIPTHNYINKRGCVESPSKYL